MKDSFLFEDHSKYDFIFSNAPFGKTSDSSIYEDAYYGYTSSLEGMFLKHSMNKLAIGGKAVLIVPDGFLLNKTKELIKLRRELLTEFNLHTILSLPQGTFAPYTGVKLSALFFDNLNPEQDIWYYELKTEKPLNKKNQITENDFSDFVELFTKRSKTLNSCLTNKQELLQKEGLSLSIELPLKNDGKDEYVIQDELFVIEKTKHEYDSLLSNYNSLISKNVKTEFITKVTIAELFTTKAGKQLDQSQMNEKGEFPVYGGNGLIGYSNQCNRYEEENIIIGRVGAHCGNVHFVKCQIWLTGNSFSLQLLNKGIVYLPYLVHVLKSLNLNKFGRGSAQASISYSKIKDIEINLPSYKQQIELSEWFEKIEEQKNNLLKSIKLQSDKFSELANYSIVSNCIK